ncbi:hypothetical protein ACQPYA_15545 [Micromonospora sp. CA-263727]|uniref:hypothetical protein n=1 Tax=Micromonospora sp. CA-263727 TaxID=3239967 RepID=UPI003D8B68CA
MSARLAAALASVVLLTIGTIAAGPAYADTTGKGPNGQRLTVSRTSGIPLAGTTVTVSGTGYDTEKGIYVAYCVDNGAGVAPSPCGGGIDTTGSTGASHWISSNPPSYGEGLAVPYGSNGSFRVQLKITARVGDVDCTTRRCVVASRNDHTRSSDRSQDVKLPVTFAAPATSTRPASPTTRAAAPASSAPAATSPSRTAAPGASATGGPTDPAVTATAATSDAEVATSAAAGSATDQPLLLTQVSDSSPAAGRWFTGTLAGLAALLVTVLVLRIVRRRRASR